MADQIINVKSGFYDAIENDRLYSADEMTMPYKRLVADGVYATPEGTPSTDLQVMASSGMTVVVKAGNAIIGGKWVESAADIGIVVPDNTDISARIDSVIVQVNKNPSGRTGNIVYRTGTPGADPQPPEINTESGIVELRLANIVVAPGAVEITDSVITDCRGSSECPWVTALIQQVDTSTLYQQWQAAYQEYYDQTTANINLYMQEQSEAWQEFFDSATQTFTVIAYFKFTGSYTTTQTTTTITIPIPAFDKSTDILAVYINGLYAAESIRYTLNDAGTAIILTAPLSAGQTVYFECLHAILPTNIHTAIELINAVREDVTDIQGDISDIQGDITDIQEDITELQYDSGWITAQLSGVTAASGLAPAYRKTADRIYMRGAITGTNLSLGSTLYTLPEGYRPLMDHYFVSGHYETGTGYGGGLLMRVGTDGAVQIAAGGLTGADASRIVPLATDFLIG